METRPVIYQPDPWWPRPSPQNYGRLPLDVFVSTTTFVTRNGRLKTCPYVWPTLFPMDWSPIFAHRNHRSLLRPFSQFQGQRFAGPIAVHNPEHFYFHLLSGAEFLLRQSGQVGYGGDILTRDLDHNVARNYPRTVGRSIDHSVLDDHSFPDRQPDFSRDLGYQIS